MPIRVFLTLTNQFSSHIGVHRVLNVMDKQHFNASGGFSSSYAVLLKMIHKTKAQEREVCKDGTNVLFVVCNFERVRQMPVAHAV